MKCASCGNYAKSEFNVFFGLSILAFKCQYCNDRLRGNITMIILDFFSIGLYVIYAFGLKVFSEELFPLFEDITFPLLGAIGFFVIRVPFTFLMMRFGKFKHLD